MNWLYLALDIFSICIPLAFSFGPKLRFYKNYNSLFPALILTALFFIVWDCWFTAIQVWEFNPDFVFGFYIFNLPFEEWLFFILIPYSCVFIYDALQIYFPVPGFIKYGNIIAVLLAIVLIVIAIIYLNHLYTSVTFLLLGILLLAEVYVFKVKFLGRFFLTYLVTLIPFAIVNGMLTSMPVLIYNNAQNLAIRIGTIPIEDFFYSMLMLLMNISIYEYLIGRNNSKAMTGMVSNS